MSYIIDQLLLILVHDPIGLGWETSYIEQAAWGPIQYQVALRHRGSARESEMAEGGTTYFPRISSTRENLEPLDFSASVIYPQNWSGSYPAKLSLPTGILDGQGEENVPQSR